MTDKIDKFILPITPKEEESQYVHDDMFVDEFELEEFMEWFPIMDQNFKMNPILWGLYALYQTKLKEYN